MFSIKLILRGLRRIPGDAPVQKLPITPDILLRLHPQFTARSDSGLWAAMLIGFYTFFRKSNLVPKSEKDFDPAKNLCRHDIFVRPLGLVICVRWSKTIQFRELQFPFCSSPRVTLSAPCTHMNVTFDNSRSPSLSLLSSITEKVKPLPLHTRHSPTNRGRFSVTQASRPKFSPWWSFLRLPLRCSRGTYQSSRGLVFGRCFALHRTTT